MTLDQQGNQFQPKSGVQIAGQHHPFQQDNSLVCSHVAAVAIQPQNIK